MTDTERKEVDLKPCPQCRHEMLHKRTTKTTVSMPVSIRCGLCDLTIEMQNWGSLVKFWNGLQRPQDNNLVSLNGLEVRKITDRYMGVTGNSDLCARDICAKFGKDNSGMVGLDISKLIDEQWAKKVFIEEFGLRSQQADYVWGFIVIHRIGFSKFSQQPPKQDNNEFGHSGDKTVSSYPEDNQQPPKERKVGLEEIAKAIHHVKCHQLCPNERELIKRIGVSGVTYCKAQAILSLLNATEERKGE